MSLHRDKDADTGVQLRQITELRRKSLQIHLWELSLIDFGSIYSRKMLTRNSSFLYYCRSDINRSFMKDKIGDIEHFCLLLLQVGGLRTIAPRDWFRTDIRRSKDGYTRAGAKIVKLFSPWAIEDDIEEKSKPDYIPTYWWNRWWKYRMHTMLCSLLTPMFPTSLAAGNRNACWECERILKVMHLCVPKCYA